MRDFAAGLPSGSDAGSFVAMDPDTFTAVRFTPTPIWVSRKSSDCARSASRSAPSGCTILKRPARRVRKYFSRY
jgi:hypothetical protein